MPPLGGQGEEREGDGGGGGGGGKRKIEVGGGKSKEGGGGIGKRIRGKMRRSPQVDEGGGRGMDSNQVSGSNAVDLLTF